MLLPIYHHHSPLSCKTYVVSSPSFFPLLSPKIPFLQNPKPSKFLLRSSTVDTGTVSKTAIQRIAEKLRSLGYIEENAKENQQPETGHGSAGEIFLPSPEHLAKQRVGYTIDSSWSTPENPVPEPGSGTTLARFYELKGEVDKQKRSAKKEDRTPSLAELRIPVTELKRLRGIGISLKKKLKVGKAGVTEGIVNGIHERWRRSELVKIQCEDLCKLNMKRTHDILERKTGGLVIWRSGSTIILYRGDNYVYPYFLADSNATTDTSHDNMSLESSYIVDGERISNSLSTVYLKSAVPSPPNEVARSSLIHGVGSPNKVRFQLPGEAQLAEEADLLLDGMGPRFTDWWGYDPLPVDADLLPAIVPGYRKPFRLLPYGVKPILTNDEMTTLKRLGRPLPCHFALGRNRNLQGLAVSMVKLWEKCEIAKIAVKRGVQNTNSEMMAEEIKRLTGGTLLSRDREFIVFYRGKDFLPPAVSTAIEERRKHGQQKPEVLVHATPEPDRGTTQQDFLDELKETAGGKRRNIISEQKKLRSTKSAIESISTKLSVALEKKDKAEKLLAELEIAREPANHEVDKEGITEEERYMLRKVGLRMKPFLLMGRRGVFDGTVENMHLHWKYRELVKIICNDRCIEDVHRAARTLESESGGILVAVERVNMGYAIIIYRGKNYQRPINLRPQTLLNKREAMKRSLEAQRRESLKLHVLKLTKNIDQLKLKLENGNIQLNCVQSAEYESSGDSSSAVESAHSQENVEAVEDHVVSMISSDDMLDGSSDDDETTKQDNLTDSFSKYDYDAAETKVESSSSKAVLEEANSKTFLDVLGEKADSDSTFCSEISLSQAGIAVDKANHYRSKNDVRRTSVESAKNQPAVSHQRHLKKGPDGLHFRAAPLSNKDRLLLRKQALKMRKRPVLAVGRNNVITGVAKTIKTHFKKHPLAIVNVKGRAEGTSIQEVVFKLEQATGAVLVSQEPNKVILYRGWGEEEEEHGGVKNYKTNGRRTENRERESQKLVSPQLMEAIRLECGLQSSHEKR